MRPKSPRLVSTVIDRLDCALARMKANGMAPRAIYLTPADYKLFAKERTRAWRDATGSRGLIWPLSHEDVPIIAESLIPAMVPVRESKGKRKSTIYSTHGVVQAVPAYA